MKKTLTILIVMMLTLSLAVLAGCSDSGANINSTALSGKYIIVSMEEDGEDVLETLRLFGVSTEGIYIEFSSKSEFTMMMTFMGEEESTAGTYQVNGNTITLTTDEDDVEGTIDGNKITVVQDGTKMVFEKK